MKLILLHLLTNLTIGSKVYFDGKVQTVVDFALFTPFSKQKLFIVSYAKPILIVLTLKNEWGGIDHVNSKVVKSIYEVGLSFNEINAKL